ncbi:MAG: SIMPL domain-containing protein [Armatimonadetes bacterium]|nr:SIMPL domain-containing protein [Armatimonadota bacterium]
MNSLWGDSEGELRGSARPVLQVSGEAEVEIEPDLVTFHLGASIRDPSASKAMADVARITERLRATLHAADIPQENIHTMQLSLRETQVPASGPAGERGETRRIYEATHALRVAVEKEGFDRLGELLDAAIRAGANYVEGIEYNIRDEAALKKEGLMEAVRDAHAKAEVMAAAANVPLLSPLRLTEGRAPESNAAVLESRYDLSLASLPSPVPPSVIRRVYTVTVEYAIG